VSDNDAPTPPADEPTPHKPIRGRGRPRGSFKKQPPAPVVIDHPRIVELLEARRQRLLADAGHWRFQYEIFGPPKTGTLQHRIYMQELRLAELLDEAAAVLARGTRRQPR